MQKKIILLVVFLYLIVLFSDYYNESKTNYFYKVAKIEKGTKGGYIIYDKDNKCLNLTNFRFYKVNIAVNDFVSKQKCSNTLYILRETDNTSNKFIVIDSIVGNKFFSKLGCAF